MSQRCPSVKWAKGRRYTLDGRRIRMSEFVRDNCDDLPNMKRIKKLKRGERINLGGGAFATFVLKRTR